MVALGTIHEWSPAPGEVVTWNASTAARLKARQAPVSKTCASAQQTQHLRGFAAHAAAGRDMARLCIGAWDVQGTCDLPMMTEAITAHLRRHDAYHSWFENRPGQDIIRRTLNDPADIDVTPTRHGVISTAALRAEILSTSDVTEWDCFSFGIIQRADHFTVYMSIDHLLTDGMSTGVIFLEIHMMYAALMQGSGPMPLPERGSYDDYCIRQRRHTDALTLESPQVRRWIAFAEQNGGTLPDFPLPLGDPSVPSTGAMVHVPLMDAAQTEQFEANCADAGVRFSGGVFACAALAEHELTGIETYHGITPYDTRKAPADYMTPGWFASFIPITVPVGAMPFRDVALAAQASFDAAKDLGDVPFDRVLELAPAELGLRNPERDVPMLSFIDVRNIPLSSEWDRLNAGIYGDSRLSDQVCVWVNRFETETTLTVSFPENPIARESVARYIEAVQTVYARAGRPLHQTTAR
jgi:hypothetical protein